MIFFYFLFCLLKFILKFILKSVLYLYYYHILLKYNWKICVNKIDNFNNVSPVIKN